jgi:hypothetical protein
MVFQLFRRQGPVTRLLADFRKKQLLQISGSTLIIRNEGALESIVKG